MAISFFDELYSLSYNILMLKMFRTRIFIIQWALPLMVYYGKGRVYEILVGKGAANVRRCAIMNFNEQDRLGAVTLSPSLRSG